MNKTAEYWRERTARRYTQCTDLEEKAEAAIRQLEQELKKREWMLNEMVYLHNTTESHWTTADLESRWTRREDHE